MTKLQLQQEVVRLQAALAAAKPLDCEVKALRAVNAELTLKLKGQIKRGNMLKVVATNNVVPIVRSFADATAIARERGITVQAAMRVQA